MVMETDKSDAVEESTVVWEKRRAIVDSRDKAEASQEVKIPPREPSLQLK